MLKEKKNFCFICGQTRIHTVGQGKPLVRITYSSFFSSADPFSLDPVFRQSYRVHRSVSSTSKLLRDGSAQLSTRVPSAPPSSSVQNCSELINSYPNILEMSQSSLKLFFVSVDLLCPRLEVNPINLSVKLMANILFLRVSLWPQPFCSRSSIVRQT